MNRKSICFLTLILALLTAFLLVSCNRVDNGTYYGVDNHFTVFKFEGKTLYITYSEYFDSTVEAKCSYKIRDGKFYVSIKEVNVYTTYTDILDSMENTEKFFEDKILEDFNDVPFDRNDISILVGDYVFHSH